MLIYFINLLILIFSWVSFVVHFPAGLYFEGLCQHSVFTSTAHSLSVENPAFQVCLVPFDFIAVQRLFVFFYMMLGVEPRASNALGKSRIPDLLTSQLLSYLRCTNMYAF